MSLALSVTQPAPACTEHELVTAVRRGDDRAFEELYSRYRGLIGSYVLGMVGDYGRSEDIAQEVFISALRRLRETESPIAFKPWIYEIARNACIDEFRRSRRAREVSLASDDDAQQPALLSRAPTPELAVESKQTLDDLRGAFRGLSENHHKIIVMRELEGLSYAEIGERMGISRPMVESTLFRARRRLSEEYEELVSGRRCEQIQTAIATSSARPIRCLGIRQQRQLARHLAHCQACRRAARLAGLDEPQNPKSASKLAALIGAPWLRWRRASADEDVAGTISHPLAALPSLPTLARFADPTSSSVAGFGRAAAAVAAIAVAGLGGGIAQRMQSHGLFGSAPAAQVHSGPGGHSAGGASGAGAARTSSSVAGGSGALVSSRSSAGSGGSEHRAGGGGGAPGLRPGHGSGAAGPGLNPPSLAIGHPKLPGTPRVVAPVIPQPPSIGRPNVPGLPPVAGNPLRSNPLGSQLPQITTPTVSTPSVTTPQVPGAGTPQVSVPPVAAPQVTVPVPRSLLPTGRSG